MMKDIEDFDIPEIRPTIVRLFGEPHVAEEQPEIHGAPMHEVDSDDRPYERAVAHGCHPLGNADLWALILRSGRPGLPITYICRELMRMGGGSLHSLERRERKELLAITGIGPVKAIQIEALFQLLRNYMHETMAERPQIRQSGDIYNLMRPVIANLPHEEIWVIYLDQSNKAIARMMVSVGSGRASIFDVKKVLKHALLENAQGLILCHNHPSGNDKPSVPDDQITQQMKKAAAQLDIRMLDHVILTPSGYYSYSDNSRL